MHMKKLIDLGSMCNSKGRSLIYLHRLYFWWMLSGSDTKIYCRHLFHRSHCIKEKWMNLNLLSPSCKSKCKLWCFNQSCIKLNSSRLFGIYPFGLEQEGFVFQKLAIQKSNGLNWFLKLFSILLRSLVNMLITSFLIFYFKLTSESELLIF